MAETDLMYPTKEDPIQGIFEDISEMASNKSDSNLTAPGDESITSNSDSVVHVWGIHGDVFSLVMSADVTCISMYVEDCPSAVA